MAEVLLSYKRVYQTFSGSIDGAPFTELTFAEMMRKARDAIAILEAPTLRILRTDRPGLASVIMEPAVQELLLLDLDEYVRIHSPPSRRVVVRGEPRIHPAKGVTPLLRAGFDTLAAALGDTVYLRLRSARVESPLTGRWERTGAVGTQLGVTLPLVFTTNDYSQGWALVPVEVLLKLEQPLFYLPRPWNVHGGWIQKGQLEELYREYAEGKAQCLLEMR